jgi:hypothetical protein
MQTITSTNIEIYTKDNDYGYFCDPAITENSPNNKQKKRGKYIYQPGIDTIYENDIESYNYEYFRPSYNNIIINKAKMYIYGGIAIGSIVITNYMFVNNIFYL